MVPELKDFADLKAFLGAKTGLWICAFRQRGAEVGEKCSLRCK